MSELALYRKITVQCPTCQANQFIEIPEYVFQQKKIGLLKIQARAGVVCPHEFIAFIDQNGVARGYEKIDYQMQFVSRSVEEHQVTDKIYLEDIIESFGDVATIQLFHAFLFSYKILVILTPTDNPQLVEKMNELFVSFMPAEMQQGRLIEGIDRKKFGDLDLKDSTCLILETSGLIVNSPWGDQKKFNFETDVIKKALEILNAKSQAALIQQDIRNLGKNSEILLTLLEKVKVIYDDEIKEKYSKQFHTKITDYLLDLYSQFIQRRITNKASLVDKIHNRSVDTIRTSIW